MRSRKRFGQHFLEPPWVRKVVDAADPRPDDRFLEIGPGRGALTEALAPRVARLVAVEIDRDLAAALTGRFQATDCVGSGAPAHTRKRLVRIIAGDFLDLDLPALIDREFGPSAPPIRAIGNLPYNAASPILFRLMGSADLFADATVMVQREVADRLVANAGTGDYGVLTVMVRVHAEVTRLLELPPGAFRPPPKVWSTVVRVRFHPPSVTPEVLPRFEQLVRGMFQRRRKTIANGLRATFPALDPVRVTEALAASGLDGTRRPETLEIADLSRLVQLVFG